MTAIRLIGGMAIIAAIGGGAIIYANFGAFLPWREATEADRLAEIACVQPGQTIAEIGAGTGRFTVAMARHVGESGRVYSTELSAKNRDAIRARAVMWCFCATSITTCRNRTPLPRASARPSVPVGGSS